MAGKENLKPIRSTEEARERGKKGGKASGKARAERKKLKEELLLLLSDGDTQEKICLALIQQARRGNIKAFEVVRDTIGEKPVDVADSMENVGSINKNILAIADLIRNPRPNRELPKDGAE